MSLIASKDIKNHREVVANRDLLAGPFPKIFKIRTKVTNCQVTLVIDSLLNGQAAGGIRMSPEVSEREVANLARLMTLKFGFANIYYGGAKAGIRTKEKLSEPERTAVLQAFGRKFAKLLQADVYRPGEDIGTCSDDVVTILEAAHCNKRAPASSGNYTAMSIVTTVEALCQHQEIKLKGASLAMEGFGKVGSHVARQLCEKGVKLLSVSTKAGTLHHPKGLNLSELLALLDRYGDACVLHYPGGELITMEQMLALAADILVLAGKPEAIHSGNYDTVKARVIVSGGNLSLTEEAEKKLVQRGHFIFPDFVANCGGVVGLNYGARLSNHSIQKLITEEFGKKLRLLLFFSERYSVTLRELSEFIALQNIKRMQKMIQACEERRIRKLFRKMKIGSYPWVMMQGLRFLTSWCRGSIAVVYASQKSLFWADRQLYHYLSNQHEKLGSFTEVQACILDAVAWLHTQGGHATLSQLS